MSTIVTPSNRSSASGVRLKTSWAKASPSLGGDLYVPGRLSHNTQATGFGP